MAIDWKFPLNGDGRDDGFNDSGMAHFSGAKFVSLVREIIQNSLDAPDEEQKEPVRVEFDVEEIESEKFPKLDNLREIFQHCCKEAKLHNDKKAEKFFVGGLDILKSKKIRMLKASDLNTTGLHHRDGNDMFHALTKGQGISDKAPDAGGLFGIGKNAPYVFSGLRTVFYSTMYKENGSTIRKAQGRSILMSHESEKGRTQGTGFYGEEKRLSPVTGDNIPLFLTREEQGTTVCVAGFPDIKGWRDRIYAAVVSNFFAAIDDKKLSVSVGKSLSINAQSLRSDFDALLDEYSEDDDFYADVKLGSQLYDTLKNGKERDIQLSKLGHCKVRIHAAEGLPQRVGLIRNTGMMITSDQKHLRSLRGIGDYIAVCTCVNKRGNRLLRSMENPQHNAFEPERLEDKADIAIGEKALKELRKGIRDRIREIAASTERKSIMLDETIGAFPGEAGDKNADEADRDFERGVVITKRRQSERRNGGGGGGGERRSVNLAKLRVVAGKSERERVAYFTPTASGKVDLDVWVVGDEDSERLQLTEESQAKARNFRLIKGERMEFRFIAAHDARGAMRITAHKESGAGAKQ